MPGRAFSFLCDIIFNMNAENFLQEKGTDYPTQPQGRVEEYPPEPHPRVEEYGQEKGTDYPTQPPSGPRFPWKKVVWFSVGAIVILGGVSAYLFYKSGPFRISGDKIIIRDSSGGAIEISTKGDLPDSFPSDIPIYPDATLAPSFVLIESDDPEQEGSFYSWQAPAPLEDVGFWYFEQLELNGWDASRRQQTSVSTLQVTVLKGERGFILELKGVSSTRTDVSLIFAEEFPQ